MRYAVLILLLASPVFADRDPVKCGRILAERMFAIGLGGGGELRLPKGCPRVLVPAPYTVATTSLGPVVMNPDGSVAASFLVPEQRETVAPRPCAVTISRAASAPKQAAAKRRHVVAGYHRQQIDYGGRTVETLVED